nr:hypothetical protein [Pseudobdellovibrionaceae bacterium]
SSQGTIFSAQRLDAKAVLLDDGIVQALVPAVPRITVITIHLKNKGLSAVELDGKFFKMDCTK